MGILLTYRQLRNSFSFMLPFCLLDCDIMLSRVWEGLNQKNYLTNESKLMFCWMSVIYDQSGLVTVIGSVFLV